MHTPEEIQKWRAAHYNATVTYIRKSHDDLMVLRVKPDFPIPPHRAGQYTTLGMGNWEPRRADALEEPFNPNEEAKVVRRAYSISHPILDEQGQLVRPGQLDYMEFYIALLKTTDAEKPPHLTPRLYLLKEGDRMYLGDRITGHFTLEGVKPTDNVVFLSTGTGEAPHNFMTWELLAQGHQGLLVLASCVRIRSDLAYRETHERLTELFPAFRYIPLTTREPGQAGRKVYIQGALASGDLERQAGFQLDPAHTHVFLCGNPKMIGIPVVDKSTGRRTYPQPQGAIEILEQHGFHEDDLHAKRRGNVHYEKYW